MVPSETGPRGHSPGFTGPESAPQYQYPPQFIEEPPPPVVRSTNRRMLLPVLGAVLALISGLMYGMLERAGTFAGTDFIAFATMLILVLGAMAIVAGYLLGTWWSLLIVPVVFFCGMLVADSIYLVGGGDWIAVLGYQFSLLAVYLMPMVAGAAIGTALVPWLTTTRRRAAR